MTKEKYDGWYRWDPNEDAWVAHPDPEAGPKLTNAQMRRYEEEDLDEGPRGR